MDAARDHMAMIQELGNTPPFSLEQFAAASRSMMVLSQGALGYRESLEMVGDAAQATGTPIEQMADIVGKAYETIRDGQPVSRLTKALVNMGVITPQTAADFKDLQESGASNIEIWDKLTQELKKFKGAMSDTEKTGGGLVTAIGSQWDNIVRKFSDTVSNTSKGPLKSLHDWLQKIQKDGSVSVWADRTMEEFERVKSGAGILLGYLAKLVDVYHWVQDAGEKRAPPPARLSDR